MKKHFYCCLLSLVLCSCKKETKSLITTVFESKKEVITPNAAITGTTPEYDYINMKGSLGMVISTEEFNFSDTLQLYKTDGKPLDKIIKDDEKVRFAYPCISKDSANYTVTYNGMAAVIKRSDKLQFQTWEEHLIKGVSSVSFDPEVNPILQKPREDSTRLPYEKDEYYFPVLVKGNWLQIKWGNNDNWKYGWIKWKENQGMLIYLYYMC